MRHVEIHLNVTWGSAFMSYQDTDETRCAWRGEMDLPSNDEAALHILWAKFQNVDDIVAETPADVAFPERSYQDRSLSCGDVVTIDGRSYAVVTLGFKPVENPIVGGPIVGPEGDARLREGSQADNAASVMAAGMVRMTADLDRVRNRG